MAKKNKQQTNKMAVEQSVSYILSRRQMGCLLASFIIAGAVVVWLGTGVVSVIAHGEAWRALLAQYSLLFAYAVLMVLFFQVERQERRRALVRYVDDAGEAFTLANDEMEV